MKNSTILASELERLKGLLNLGYELKVEWRPGYVKYSSGRRLSGEVLGNVIYIYDEREPEALATARHEFIEYVLANELSAPYKRVVNSLITLLEDEAYQRREMVVKKFCDILRRDENDSS